jgi:uncharacterized protein (TIGR02246 family)
MRKTRWVLASLGALALSGALVVADDDPKANASGGGSAEKGRGESADEKGMREQVDAFIKAFNAGDAPAIGRMYAEDARMIDVQGEVVEGREAIEREYAALFKENPGLKIEIHVDDQHLVSRDAAVEVGTTRVTPRDGAPPVVNRYTAVSTRNDGQWLLASVRETPGQLSAEDHLKAVEWLIGEWVDESGDSVIHTTCRWSKDRQALLREFSIRTGGKVVMTGTQRIGWDPRAEQIRSWEFDSEGGHGEGLWSRLGDQWIIKATGVLQDGRTATATHMITPESPTSCRWRTTDRTVGGHVIALVEEFVLVRPAPEAGAK